VRFRSIRRFSDSPFEIVVLSEAKDPEDISVAKADKSL